MAKLVKKKKKLRLEGLAAVLLFFASVCYVSSSLFLRTYNNSLSARQQSVSRDIAALQTENDALKIEVQSLSTRDHVTGIAAEDGMTQNQGNIVTIAKTGE